MNRAGSVPVIQTWPPASSEPVEQGGAADGIEMGGDLVEQQDRAAFTALGDEIGMGEDQADQQRLLLAGRAEGGGLVLGGVGDEEIGAVRAGEGAAGGGVAGRGDNAARSAAPPAFQRDQGAGERAFGRGGEPLGQAPRRSRRGPRRSRRHVRPSALPARASQASSHGPSSASSLLRARIAAS